MVPFLAMRVALVAVIVAWPMGQEQNALGQGGGWIGQRVVTKTATPLLSVAEDKGGLDAAKSVQAPRRLSQGFRIYRVEQAKAAWLWLVSEDRKVSGWVEADRVIAFDQAIDYFSDQIRAHPDSSANYDKRGTIWTARGEFDKAIADYTNAIRCNPKSCTAFRNRATSWFKKQEYDKAIADLTEAIRLDPKYDRAYSGRAAAHFAKKEYDKAIVDYSEAIRLDPKDASAYHDRASTWFRKRDYEKAVSDYSEAIRLDPKDALAYRGRGSTWFSKRDYEKAVSDYSEAIRLDPKDASAYRGRGLTGFAIKQHDKAIADCSEATRLDPKEGLAYVIRLMACLEASRKISIKDCRDWLETVGRKNEEACYILILGHLCLRRCHREEDARRLLGDAAREGISTDWPYPVVRYLRREINAPALIAAVAVNDEDALLDAKLYVGLDLIILGRPRDSLAYLQWVKEHADMTALEYLIAAAEYDRVVRPAREQLDVVP